MLISNFNHSSGFLNLTNSIDEEHKSFPKISGSNTFLDTFNDFSGGKDSSKKLLSSNVVPRLEPQDDLFSFLNRLDNNEDKLLQDNYLVEPQSNYSSLDGLANPHGNLLADFTSNDSYPSSSLSNALPPLDEIFSFENRFKNIVNNWATATESSSNTSFDNLNNNQSTSNATSLNFDLR